MEVPTPSYARSLIDRHEKCPCLPVVIRASIPVGSQISEAMAYPLVMIWDPEKQFKDIVGSPITCPNTGCGGELVARKWLLPQNESGSASYKPRTIFSCDGEVLLVARFYSCSKTSSHQFRGYAPEIIDMFKAKGMRNAVPFVLSHRAGMTRDLYHEIPTLAMRGVSFTAMSSFWKKEFYRANPVRFFSCIVKMPCRLAKELCRVRAF